MRALSLLLLPCLIPGPAAAFCGFYVARADAALYNNASQVVMVHDEGKTVLTMVNNYRGEPQAFALVVPVPVVLERELVRVVEVGPVQHLDAWTAPRLVEYFDPDPCAPPVEYRRSRAAEGAKPKKEAADDGGGAAFGVKVEAAFTVGEYDIVILSAAESNGLESWLRANQYNIPRGAATALAPYVRSGMKFFVAKVNLKEQAKTGFSSLRPLQFAFPDERFMLPIRLGMLNADGPQELLVYTITRQYRVEVANYRNPKLPSNLDVPTFVKGDFSRFYKDLFTTQVKKENQRAVFTEHAWNMAWCDPCAADPLSNDELERLGVWWLDGASGGRGRGAPAATFVTRLHARYTPETFPEDLALKLTKDASNFQARFVLRHPFAGRSWCPAVEPYLKALEGRRETEVRNLANLTGWDPNDIRARLAPLPSYPDRPAGQDDDWKQRMKRLFQKGG